MTAGNRNYKGSQPLPELVYALTDYTAMNGLGRSERSLSTSITLIFPERAAIDG
ncbi:hypothetical protein O9929_15610 [Vibrio lentus]|nr:hypothetical protein [Vibrio lentus]